MNDTLSVLNLRRPTPHPELSYWSVCRVEALFERPFLDLVFEAASVTASISMRSASSSPPCCR